jgi:hypothetical protein
MTWLLPQMALVTRTLLGLPHQSKAHRVPADTRPMRCVSGRERIELGTLRLHSGVLWRTAPSHLQPGGPGVFHRTHIHVCLVSSSWTVSRSRPPSAKASARFRWTKRRQCAFKVVGPEAAKGHRGGTPWNWKAIAFRLKKPVFVIRWMDCW